MKGPYLSIALVPENLQIFGSSHNDLVYMYDWNMVISYVE